MHLRQFHVLTSLLLASATHAATYRAINEYSGRTFFDGWDFYDHHDDKMNGDVVFVSAAQGASERLAYVDPTTNRAIIKVDNSSFVPWNEKRRSVRITSKESYGIGSLWIADMYHMPYGCSVWPGWWSHSVAAGWPQGGEIDTMEGVNRMPSSQMALHTTPGCQQVNPVQTSTLVNGTNCASGNGDGHGCVTTNDDPASFGEAFARAQGGVFVTEFAATGISMWFFPREQVPESITASRTSVDTASLGVPMANWPSGGCDIPRFFQPQNLVFTVTLCGDFAGPGEIFNQTCSGVCYNDFVISEQYASLYSTAYFDVSYVRVYSSNPDVPSSLSTTGTPAGSSTQGGPPAPTNTNGSKSTVHFASLLQLGTLILGAAMALVAL